MLVATAAGRIANATGRQLAHGVAISQSAVQSCLIMTKTGRCVVNCEVQPAAVKDEERDQGHSTRLVVGQLCKLLVTMHAVAGGTFLSYVQIHTHGVVLVDGGPSFLVALVCQSSATSASVSRDLPSIKLKAVQIRHAFATSVENARDVANQMQTRRKSNSFRLCCLSVTAAIFVR